MSVATEVQATTTGAGGFATVPQVAEYLNVSRSKVYMLMEEGLLTFVKLGKSRRVPWAAVHKMVEDNTVRA